MDKLPEDHQSVTSPHYNIKVFDYWGDYYNAVFILFKPFYQFKIGSDFNRKRLSEHPRKWEDWDDIIQNECIPVKWQTVKDEVGFSEFWEVEDGLTLGPDVPENKFKLNKYLESKEMLQPAEDIFSCFQVEAIANSFKFLGYEMFYTGPQAHNIGFEKVQFYTTPANPSDLLNTQNIYSPDRSLLFTTAFDFHYGFICSSRETIQKLIEAFQFEGFFADKNTTTWWARKFSETDKI